VLSVLPVSPKWQPRSRDDSVIHVNYEIVPPLDLGSHQPRGEAKDDLGNVRDRARAVAQLLESHCGSAPR
jgi:hypothetical protein